MIQKFEFLYLCCSVSATKQVGSNQKDQKENKIQVSTIMIFTKVYRSIIKKKKVLLVSPEQIQSLNLKKKEEERISHIIQIKTWN